MAQYVQTVLGPVHPDQLGKVLHHEHLTSLTPGPWLSGGRPESLTEANALIVAPEDANYVADQVQTAVGALSELRKIGFGTVVDLSPYSVVGRSALAENLPILQEVSRRTGLHIVAGSSVYLEPYSPRWSTQATLAEMTERFTRDVTTGIGSTPIRAGILGEQATGLDAISAHEEKCLRAAARAHVRTGVALVTHTTHGTMALEQLTILAQEGADLSRVVIGHLDIQPDLDYLLAVLDTGVNIAFDTIGKQHWDFVLEPPPDSPAEGAYLKRAYYRADQSRAERLVDLVSRGYADQLLLSQDLTGAEVPLNPATHGQWGYAYLGKVFIPLALENGLPDKAVDTILRLNPARLLTQGAV